MIVGIVQARTTSSRLPGKVLEPIVDVPMIGRQLHRLHQCATLDLVAVATSSDPSDDLLATYVESLGIPVVRGPLDDVLQRYVLAINDFSPEVVVRLTADCPLASPSVIDSVVQAFLAGDWDYVSNTLQPSYPDGLDVEVVRPEALRWVAQNSSDPHEHEHVTLGVYRRPERFRLHNVAGSVDYSSLRWTVDNADDLEFVRSVYQRLLPINPEFDFEDVLALLAREPDLSRTSDDAARNTALNGLDTGAMQHGQ